MKTLAVGALALGGVVLASAAPAQATGFYYGGGYPSVVVVKKVVPIVGFPAPVTVHRPFFRPVYGFYGYHWPYFVNRVAYPSYGFYRPRWVGFVGPRAFYGPRRFYGAF